MKYYLLLHMMKTYYFTYEHKIMFHFPKLLVLNPRKTSVYEWCQVIISTIKQKTLGVLLKMNVNVVFPFMFGLSFVAVVGEVADCLQI